MNRPWRFVIIVAAMASACSNSPDDFATPWYPDAPIEQITAGDGWALELVRPDGSPACWQIRVGDRATGCWGLVEAAGGFASGALRGPGADFEFVVVGETEPMTFLWFSSLHDGLGVDGYLVEGSQFVVIELASDEEPWGMQILDADGALVTALSFVNRG